MHIDVGHTPSFRISLKIKGGVNMTEADAVKIKNEELSNIILYSTAMLISMVGTSIYTFAIGALCFKNYRIRIYLCNKPCAWCFTYGYYKPVCRGYC
jgi:hypothetical protein